jgi:calpain-7
MLLVAPHKRIKDVNETEDGSRWLTILDSWLPPDGSTEVDALLDDLSLENEGKDQRRRDDPFSCANSAHLNSGSIDIPWDDVCTLFGSICLSWNPVMFKNQLVYHGLVPGTRRGHLRLRIIQGLESRPSITCRTR